MDLRTLFGKFVKQYFIILAGANIAMAVYCTILTPEAVITIKFLRQMLFLCVLADTPVFVYYSKKELTRKQWNIRTVVHTLLLEAVLLLAGWKFGIYNGIYSGIFFALIVLLVDVFVRVMTYTKDWKMADDINRKIRERSNEKQDKK